MDNNKLASELVKMAKELTARNSRQYSINRELISVYLFRDVLHRNSMRIDKMDYKHITDEVTKSIIIASKTPSILGRNIIRKGIWERLTDEKQKEYIKAVTREKEIYNKVEKAHKKVLATDYNLSIPSAWQEYHKDLLKELDKTIPNVFTIKHIVNLSKDKASVKGYGSFKMNTGWDENEYLTAVVMSSEGYINPDSHKEWL